MTLKPWQGVLLGLVAYQGTITALENLERWSAYRRARAYCDSIHKPLLRIGMRRVWWEPPNGDTTIDLDPQVTEIPGGVIGDERHMPQFADKQFGAVLNQHTLEHLTSIDDVIVAVKECSRVADIAVFLCPHPFSLINFVWRSHNLQVRFQDGAMFVRDNPLRLPFSFSPPSGDASVVVGRGRETAGRQMLVTTKEPQVLPWNGSVAIRPILAPNTNANAQLVGAVGAGLLTYGVTTGARKAMIIGSLGLLTALLMRR